MGSMFAYFFSKWTFSSCSVANYLWEQPAHGTEHRTLISHRSVVLIQALCKGGNTRAQRYDLYICVYLWKHLGSHSAKLDSQIQTAWLMTNSSTHLTGKCVWSSSSLMFPKTRFLSTCSAIFCVSFNLKLASLMPLSVYQEPRGPHSSSFVHSGGPTSTWVRLFSAVVVTAFSGPRTT